MIKIKTIINTSVMLVCFLFVFCVQANVQVHMRVLDMHGYELEQVQVGKPFTVEIAVQGVENNVADPTIKGARSFDMHRTSYQMSTMNNRSTVKYLYATQSDKQGVYSLGPAVVQNGNKVVESNILKIKVGHQEIPQKKSESKSNDTMFLKFSVDNEQVVAGQRLEGTITFYTSMPDVSITSVTDPAIDGFVRLDKAKPRQGVEHINGKQYSYAQWRWKFFPKEPGRLTIPSCYVDVAYRAEDDYFSAFASFFQARQKRERIFSDALTINVKALPEYSGIVDAVGQFKNFTATVNQAVAREGDGIVVSLSIDGDSDIDNLNLELQNLPNVFKSYSSKQHVEKGNKRDQLTRKTFEFIVQGMEAGEWELPEQKFTYYDVYDEQYKTLTTSPLILKILSQPSKKKYVPPSNDFSTKTAIDMDGDVGSVFALNTYGHWHEIPERKMPGWLFMVLFFAPLGIWFSGALRRTIVRYKKWRAPQAQWRSAFKIARKKLKLARKENNFSAIYRLFVELFTLRCSVKDCVISQEMTKKILTDGGLSEEQVCEWEEFFNTISAFVFYNTEGGQGQEGLFDQADKWIKVLEDIL